MKRLVYADSSVLVSAFGRDNAAALIGSLRSAIVLTAFHRVEVKNAFSPMVYRGACTAPEAARAWRGMMSDVRAGRIILVEPDWGRVLRRAWNLSKAATQATGVRTLDVIHIALAKEFRLRKFLSFDTRQRTLAARVGLTVLPALP